MMQQLKNYAREYPTAFRILLIVVVAHFSAALIMLVKKPNAPLFAKKPLTVNTKYLPPQRVQVATHTSTPRKQTKRYTSKKTTSRTPKRKKLLQSLAESIAKIDEKRDKDPLKSELTFPKHIDFSQVFVENEQLQENYQRLLLDELKSSLRLPMIGAVRIKLILEKNGQVVDVEVLQSECEANREYLLSTLQRMTFPPFVDSLKDYDQQTFLLTFCNN